MTPKEKAIELIEKFKNYVDFEDAILDYQECIIKNAKLCALIAVDEILDLNLGFSNCDENNWAIEKFYIEVKQEIEKL